MKNAAVMMAHSARHSDWVPPKATMDSPDGTIKIQPSEDATYIPSNWRFELDNELVFRRLIDDLYSEPASFVRELIQNALDATRCQMYLDMQTEGIKPPEFPTQVDIARRQRYPIRVSLEMREVRSPLSSEIEKRQVVVVEDFGIGMDRHIIHDYLLQVGRSFYTTQEFQREFGFVPASRYGVGFLSVFSVSDHISFDTYKPSSRLSDGPLRVNLSGPKNYLLLERSERARSGTRVEVMMRHPFKDKELTDLVQRWCRRVEFPVNVRELGNETVVVAEHKGQFVYEYSDVLHEGVRFAIRAFDIQRYGIEGELYVFMRIEDEGESWDAWNDAYYTYPKLDPRASKPNFPSSLYCIHGIGIESGLSSGPYAERLDFRGGSIPVPSLSRERVRYVGRRSPIPSDERVKTRWVEIIEAHLHSSRQAQLPDGWRYKQTLADGFPVREFWACLPGTIPIHSKQENRTISLKEATEFPTIVTILPPQVLLQLGLVQDRKSMAPPAWDEEIPAMLSEELARFCKAHRAALFERRAIYSTRWLSSGHLALYWKAGGEQEAFGGPSYRPSLLAPLWDPYPIGIEIMALSDTPLDARLFNTTNPFVQWVIRVKKASKEGVYGLNQDHFEHLHELLAESCGALYYVERLEKYVNKWRQMRELPGELSPPRITISPQMFLRIPRAP